MIGKCFRFGICRPEVFFKKSVVKACKHKIRLQQGCFHVNFVFFLRSSFLQNISLPLHLRFLDSSVPIISNRHNICWFCTSRGIIYAGLCLVYELNTEISRQISLKWVYQRHIQISVQHWRWKLFAKIING